ncbi:MAG TPA: type II toxin-antitoxin system prevent-host-death family antitoxin [Gemmatimonadaceae bacterium]|nr:type II toxin-antitoxin system prevent-host-death family antitoxin [Gemmatimonadaceae bacterium]
MKKVGIAEFKARLSEYLRYVRRGHEITILDRDQPVARVTPSETRGTLRVREPAGPYRRPFDVPMPPPLKLTVDPVALLLEDRQGEE